MSSPATSLGPRTLGEILDRTAQLYRGNFLLFTGISVIPIAVMILIFVPIGILAGYMGLTVKTAPSSTSAIAAGAVVLAILLVGMPIFLVATVYSQAGLSFAAVRTHMGQTLKIRDALQEVNPHFWRYLWLLILQGIMVALIPAAIGGAIIAALAFLAFLAGNGTAVNAVLGFFIFLLLTVTVVVIVLRAMRYSLGMAVCVTEGKTAWQALKRALALSKGSRGRIFVMFLLVWALSIVLSMIGYIPSILLVAIVTAVGHGAQYGAFAIAAAQILNFLMNFSMQTLIAPIYVTALVLFYYDQRVRTEGYDIEWMMEQAGLTSPGPPLEAGGPHLSPNSTMPPDSVREP